jgi:ketosteroid isomerase-like protein
MARAADATVVAEAYFAAIAARDPAALSQLFAPDAELVSGDTVTTGRDAIIEFYVNGAFTFEDLLPRPGPLDVDGGRVHVVIELRMAGADHVVADTFHIADNVIRRLEIVFDPESMRNLPRGFPGRTE